MTRHAHTWKMTDRGMCCILCGRPQPVPAAATCYERAARKLARNARIQWTPVNGYYGRAWAHRNSFDAPRPNSPLRFAIWLHEFAHLVLHDTGRTTPRWRQECEAWAWALREYRDTCGPAPAVVRRRVRACLRYAIRKAARRGYRFAPGAEARAARAITN